MPSVRGPGFTGAGADHVWPSSVDFAKTASFLPSLRKRPSSQTAYRAPDFGSGAAAGRPSEARCAGIPFDLLAPMWIGGVQASGAGYGVWPAAGAAMKT